MSNRPFVPDLSGHSFTKSRRRNNRCKVETKKVLPFLHKYGIILTKAVELTSDHIEMLRKTIMNYFRRLVALLIRIFTNKSMTAKSQGVRLGKGKGSISKYVQFIKSKKVIAEFSILSKHSPEEADLEALKVVKIVSSKLPSTAKCVINPNFDFNKVMNVYKKLKTNKTK